MKLTSKSLKNLIKEVLEEQQYEWSNSAEAARKRFFELKPLVQAGQLEFEDELNAAGRRMTQPDSVMSPEEQAAQMKKFPPRAMDPEADREEYLKQQRYLAQQADLERQAKEDDDYDFKRNPNEPYSAADLRVNMYEGDASILEIFENATLEEGGLACGGCLFEMLQEASCGCPDLMGEAVYDGKTVTLNKPTRGDVKKFKVYVNSGKKDKEGRIKAKKVNFGHGGSSAKAKGEKTMKIRKNNPEARANFRARHNCDTATDNKTPRYWSCKKW
jgi:hypothetical protein